MPPLTGPLVSSLLAHLLLSFFHPFFLPFPVPLQLHLAEIGHLAHPPNLCSPPLVLLPLVCSTSGDNQLGSPGWHLSCSSAFHLSSSFHLALCQSSFSLPDFPPCSQLALHLSSLAHLALCCLASFCRPLLNWFQLGGRILLAETVSSYFPERHLSH